ncbi:MAG: alanine racemase [Actinomycetota bacterium]
MRRLEINLSAISENYATLKSVTGVAVMAIVKANAFGHGMIEVAKALEGAKVDVLGVADIDEALELREASVHSRIFCWLHGQNSNFLEALRQNIEIGLSTTSALEKVAAAAKATGKKASVHLKIDTGLGRSGASIADWPELVIKAKELSDAGLISIDGVFSHLSGTSEAEDREQVREFDRAIESAKELGVVFPIRHIAASLAALSYPFARYEMVRVGLALYGLDPSPTVLAKDAGLRPAMRAVSEVVQLKQVPAGHGVSYGYVYKTSAPTTLALVPFGYAEGLPRLATGKAEVLLRGKRYKILARIAMDQFILDVGHDQIEVGDEVVIIGDGSKGEPTAEELGLAAQTINYEIVTRMGGRAKRVYI